jgi:hypothetical protein
MLPTPLPSDPFFSHFTGTNIGHSHEAIHEEWITISESIIRNKNGSQKIELLVDEDENMPELHEN